jgi:hypothetical protein
MAALGITTEIKTYKPLHKPVMLQSNEIIAVNGIAEKGNSLAKGGLLAYECGTGKVRPCCALETCYSPH